MCGINGLYYFDRERLVDRSEIERMRVAAVHRGPDDHGCHVSGRVGFGFNRLSIIDLAGGHQPMSTDDHSVWIVFNGEIYNFRELRGELTASGHRFRTRSDTEVILRAWEQFGEETVAKLRGMFAFAIWDSRRDTLFCARDRLGIKPFYYHYDDGNCFAFASELKALVRAPGFSAEIDRNTLEEYFRHRYVIAPRTMIRGIAKLPPGHCLSIDGNGLRIRRYWDLPLEASVSEASESALLEEFTGLMDETIKQHLISDVPLGAFLSGGLDSSAVVAMMHRFGAANIKTFSIGYDSPESELPYAEIVARHFRTDHYPLVLTPGKFRDLLPRIVWHMDEPVGDEASLPLYCLAEFARQRVTVAMSGEGSDEIFAGYPIYRTMLGYETLNRIPLAGLFGKMAGRLLPSRKIRRYSSMLGQPLEARYQGVSRVLERDELRRLLPKSSTSNSADPVAAAYRRSAGVAPLDRMCYLDLKTWLADDLLVKADRMSMASSLELRVPFLDHKVVEFAFRLPPAMKIHGGVSKYLLRTFVTPMLPRQILERPKKGFPVPTKAWFREDLAGFARETLLEANGPSRNFLAPAAIEGILADHRRGDLSGPIYALLVFDQWCRGFLRN